MPEYPRVATRSSLMICLATVILVTLVATPSAHAQDVRTASAATDSTGGQARLALTQPAASRANAYQATAQLDRLLGEIRTEGHAPVALAKALSLQRLIPHLPADLAAQKLTEASATTAQPLAAFELWRAARTAELDQFDGSLSALQRAEEIHQSVRMQGCLADFALVGPFDNPSMQAFHNRLAPEDGLPGPYDGKMTRIDWRDWPGFGRLCTMYLSQVVEPATASVAYLASELTAQRAGPAKLLLGAAGAYKVWLNGKPVARRDEDRGLSTDAQTWAISLKKGPNHLLIKLASTGEGTLGLSARVTDPQLRPIADLAQHAAWHPASVAAQDEAHWPEPTRDSVTQQADALMQKTDAPAIWAAWLRMRLEPDNAATPWRATAERVRDLARKGAAAIPARELALAAELFEEHWQTLDLLELATERDPADPWIAGQLARAYAGAEALALQQKEREILERLHADYPDFLPATAALSDWYAGRGFDHKALQVLQEFVQKNAQNLPESRLRQTPRFVALRAWLTSIAGEREESRALYRQMESIAATNTSYAWRRAQELLSQNDLRAALEVVETQRRFAPWELRWQLQKVDILRANGDFENAETLLEELIAQRPGNVDLHRKHADLLLAKNQVDPAIDALDRAIVQRPQDQELRKLREFLAPASDRFYKPWMVEDLREIAQKTPPSAYSYDILVDQTLVHVEPNGLSSSVMQRAVRVLTADGVDSARFQRVAFTRGDEEVEVLGVRVHKTDGTISEDWNEWHSGGARKGSSTYNDSTYLNLRANHVQVGDIVEFRWRTSQVANENFRGDYFGDIAYVQGTRPTAITRYVVHYPKSWTLYFRAPTSAHKRLDRLPGDARLKDGYQLAGFELGSIPEVHTDHNQPGYTDVYDYVMVSNKKDYNEIGRWWWNLVEEQLIVDDDIAQKVAELTRGLKTEAEKVQAIHNYVVQNTRYLHVGLGIHGWKPYRTTTAFRNRYGDCKDKAALLKVMLDEAGIPAKLVLVRTRQLGRVEAEPASMHIFNHAITYVPGMDLFLDGTAEFNGTTELTSMDQGAQALIVDDGGKATFLTLPIDKPEQNLLQTELTVDLSADEPITRAKIVAHGQNAAYFRELLEDRQRRDEIFEKQLAESYPGARLVRATYSDLSKLEQPVTITFEFRGGDFLRQTSAQQFVYALGAPKDLLSAYAAQASRTQDLSIRLPFLSRTTLRYVLPADQEFAEAPRNTQLESPFGAFKVTWERAPDALHVDVQYALSVQQVAVQDYPEFRQFMTRMTTALNETVALKPRATTAPQAQQD